MICMGYGLSARKALDLSPKSSAFDNISKSISFYITMISSISNITSVFSFCNCTNFQFRQSWWAGHSLAVATATTHTNQGNKIYLISGLYLYQNDHHVFLYTTTVFFPLLNLN